MNAKELETQHNLKKWAAIIKECRSSGMKILQWLEINNISKDQYYYWQRKLKETCIDTLERQAATFEITNTATPDFIKNLIEAFNHA